MNKYQMEIVKKFEYANSLLMQEDLFVEIVLVGGSAFILKGLVPRATFDVDSIQYIHPRHLDILAKAMNIDNRVLHFEQNYGIWDEDVEKLVHYSNLKVNTISNERLVATRIFGPKRYDDATHAAKTVKLNRNKFEEIVEEIFSYSDPVLVRDFKENEWLIEEIFKIQEWDYETSNIKNLYKR